MPVDEPTNLLIPFRRDQKRDFAFASGPTLIRSQVRQVLLTRGGSSRSAGELPWRTDFGAGLDFLRHERNNHVLEELVRFRVRDALRRWVPTAQASSVRAGSSGATMSVRVGLQIDGATSRESDPSPLLLTFGE